MKIIKIKINFSHHQNFNKILFFRSHITEVFTNNQIEKVDFSEPENRRAEINAFVEEVTNGFIKDLLPAGSISPSTNVILANAAFFKGLWVTQFDKAETKTKTFKGFYEEKIEMMHVKNNFKYGSDFSFYLFFLVFQKKEQKSL